MLDSALDAVRTTGTSVQGLVINALIILVVALIYCFKVGGVREAALRLRRANWPWLLTDVCLPLGIPIIVGLLFVGMTWLAELPFIPKPGLVVTELTPWTLCFFSLTILAASLRRVSGAGFAYWNVLVWLAIAIISVFSAILTIARSSDGWHPGIRPYSASILLTCLAIYLAHGTTRPAPSQAQANRPS